MESNNKDGSSLTDKKYGGKWILLNSKHIKNKSENKVLTYASDNNSPKKNIVNA